MTIIFIAFIPQPRNFSPAENSASAFALPSPFHSTHRTFSELSAMEKDFWSFIARQTFWSARQDFSCCPGVRTPMLGWLVLPSFFAIMLQKQEKI